MGCPAYQTTAGPGGYQQRRENKMRPFVYTVLLCVYRGTDTLPRIAAPVRELLKHTVSAMQVLQSSIHSIQTMSC